MSSCNMTLQEVRKNLCGSPFVSVAKYGSILFAQVCLFSFSGVLRNPENII